ncbi:MFS general substrate transporter [Boletus coccyginus]|nr:MFS general substrate transporter [Boletus coccyginus]
MSFSPSNRLLGDNDESGEYGTFTQQGDFAEESFGDTRRCREIEKTLLRKLDLRSAFLVLVYIMNYVSEALNSLYLCVVELNLIPLKMDRNNAAAARLKGLEEDLHMSGTQFNTLISILYVGYVLIQTPSNWFLSKIVKPSAYLSGGMCLWGVISIATGVSWSYHSALVSRFLLGFVEATFFPGALFLLSKWYTRNELGLRVAILTCGSSISNAFGSVIASGILSVMDGASGVSAWRWLFFIEGALTIIISIVALFVIPDFPSSPANWLTPEEHLLARVRLEEDLRGLKLDQPRQANEYSLWDSLTDWKIWWLGISLSSMITALSFGNFFPTLCATMGYSPTITLLLCAPPWLVGTTTSFLVTRHSDSSGDRFWHITGPMMMGVIGFIIAISTMDTAIRYVSFFFMTQASVAYVVFMTWVSNSIPESSSKRAVGIAFINTSGALGNVWASYIWPMYWGPTYVNSYFICIMTSLLSIAMCWVYRLHLTRLNKEAETKERISGLQKGFRYFI